METKKVTIGMGKRDIENVEYLQENLYSRSKASAVGQSLDIAKLIVEFKRNGGEVILKDGDGNLKELVIPGVSI